MYTGSQQEMASWREGCLNSNTWKSV